MEASTNSVSCCPSLAFAARGKTVISNATRWDTFENMIGEDKLPESEKLFRWGSCVSGLVVHLVGVDGKLLPGSEKLSRRGRCAW